MSREPVDPLRQERPLFGQRRAHVEALEAEVRTKIHALDAELGQLYRERKLLVEQLRSHERRLRVRLGRPGRRPAPDGSEELPPLPVDVTWLYGRRLRAVCLQLLVRLGPMRLVELHRLLHRHHFAVASRHAVKALADALGYEADEGRARRIRRGTYEASPAARLRTGPLWPGGPSFGSLEPPAAA